MKSLIFIVDTSYSIMQYLKNYIQTINSVIQSMKETDPDSTLTFITFNSTYTIHVLNQPIASLEKLFSVDEIRPNGMTALYDSLGAALVNLEKFYDKIERNDAPVVVILTDGDDTSSRVLKPQHLLLQISKLQHKLWKFIFLGTTDQSINLGKSIGCNSTIVYNPTPSCFESIVKIVGTFFKNDKVLYTFRTKPLDADLRELEEQFKSMEL